MEVSNLTPRACNRFSKFNPVEREVMRCALQYHINTIGEICVALDQREIYIGRYFVIFEELLREIQEA